MRCPQTLLPLLLLLSPVLAAEPAPEAEEERAETEDVLPLVQEQRIHFHEDLGLQSDLRLEGVRPSAEVVFPNPSGWELTHDPQLTVDFLHSMELLGSDSTLTVALNDQPLGTVRLTADNSMGGTLTLDLPRGLLDDYNRLSFTAEQRIGAECEDPFDPSLWTRVSQNSSIQFRYALAETPPDFSSYPFPLFDELGYGPMELTLTGPMRFTESTIEALSLLSMSFGRIADYRGVSFLDPVLEVEQLQSHGLVLGTFQDNPLISTLVDRPQLDPGQGLLAIVPHPDQPGLQILVVAGADEGGLVKAAQALSGGAQFSQFQGSQVLIQEVSQAKPPAPRGVPLHAPGQQEFTLADLGYQDTTVRGYYAAPIRQRIRFEGDSQPRVDGTWMDLKYGYSAQLDGRLSSLEVRMNGVVLRSIPLTEEEGIQEATTRIELPYELLREEPTAELTYVFHLFPKDFDPCRRVSDRMLWGSIKSSSTVHAEMDHYADVPDLGLLRYDLWPYTLQPEKGGTTLMLSDKPTRNEISAAAELVALLSRLSPHEELDLEVIAAYEAALSERSDRHIILLSSENKNSAYKELAEGQHLTLHGDRAFKLSGEDGVLLQALRDQTLPSIEQTFHPANEERLVMVLRTGSEVEMRAPMAMLSNPARLVHLEGNMAVYGEQIGIRSLSLKRMRTLGEAAVVNRMGRSARESWIMLGVGVILAAFALKSIIGVWARRRDGEV